ncbi:hypothetical protein [Aquihabitans sp. McL0605]|uniref:hypothetical protein n=1 Tax=Aquihabitans sp. McL0605 TaxID=3415671 RepID=UPI003CEA176C
MAQEAPRISYVRRLYEDDFGRAGIVMLGLAVVSLILRNWIFVGLSTVTLIAAMASLWVREHRRASGS